jgi:hypothetical protein
MMRLNAFCPAFTGLGEPVRVTFAGVSPRYGRRSAPNPQSLTGPAPVAFTGVSPALGHRLCSE